MNSTYPIELAVLATVGHALVPLRTDAHGPRHRRACAYAGLPLLAHLRQIICSTVRRAASIRAVHHNDFFIRQAHMLIDCANLRRIPRTNLPQKYSRQYLRGQVQPIRRPFHVINWNDRAQHGSKLQQLASLPQQLLRRQRHVRRSEIQIPARIRRIPSSEPTASYRT